MMVHFMDWTWFFPGDCHGEWIELYNPDECQSIDISFFLETMHEMVVI